MTDEHGKEKDRYEKEFVILIDRGKMYK